MTRPDCPSTILELKAAWLPVLQDRQRWRAAEERRTTECASLVQQQQATAVTAGAAREAALQAEISALQQRTADLEVLLCAAADDNDKQ